MTCPNPKTHFFQFYFEFTSVDSLPPANSVSASPNIAFSKGSKRRRALVWGVSRQSSSLGASRAMAAEVLLLKLFQIQLHHDFLFVSQSKLTNSVQKVALLIQL